MRHRQRDRETERVKDRAVRQTDRVRQTESETDRVKDSSETDRQCGPDRAVRQTDRERAQ